MSTTSDLVKERRILRTFIENDGAISAEAILEPSVLPMTSFDFVENEQIQYVMALKTRTGIITKGQIYELRSIYQNGMVVIGRVGIRTSWKDLDGLRDSQIPGLFPMAYFAQMITTRVKTDVIPFSTGPDATSRVLLEGEGTPDTGTAKRQAGPSDEDRAGSDAKVPTKRK